MVEAVLSCRPISARTSAPPYPVLRHVPSVLQLVFPGSRAPTIIYLSEHARFGRLVSIGRLGTGQEVGGGLLARALKIIQCRASSGRFPAPRAPSSTSNSGRHAQLPLSCCLLFPLHPPGRNRWLGPNVRCLSGRLPFCNVSGQVVALGDLPLIIARYV